MATAPHILICDDDPVVHESLGLYFENEHFTYSSAYDGRDALAHVASDKPDLIILDVMMPEKTGIEVCREIRKTLSTPIIILTAKGEEIDRVLGLELGADDYIVKPFSPREVIARIKAVLRRINEPQENTSLLRFEGLEINLDNYQVKVKANSFPALRRKLRSCIFLLPTSDRSWTVSRFCLSSGVMTISVIHVPLIRTSSVSVRRSITRELRGP